ncbi:MAG: peptidoglycan binding domain-containing protein [Syntrophomonas sp.]|nr:peptidoglycan binding domain-containing protein [Syntrophomonas sp.]
MTDGTKTMARVISLIIVAVIITICLSSLALAARDEKIYPSNFWVGGVTIANQTRQAAWGSLEKGMNEWDAVMHLKITSTSETISFPIEDIGIRYDLDKTLQKVNELVDNPRATDSLWKNSLIRGKTVNIAPILVLDDVGQISAKLLEIKERTDKQAFDARVIYNDGVLEYISHEYGSALDINATLYVINEALSQGNLGPVSLVYNELSPRVKNEDIKNVKELVGVSATKLDYNLTTQKDLEKYIEIINGTVIIPGDTFSISDKLKQQVETDRAYKIIADTIYESCLSAHIQLADKSMQRASSQGFKIMNNMNDPILLHLSIEDKQLLAKIYGCQTEAGKEISLIRQQTVLDPMIVEKTSTALKPQERIVQQQGESGMQIKTYRLVKLNGVQVSEELLTEATYPPSNTIILIAPDSSFK